MFDKIVVRVHFRHTRYSTLTVVGHFVEGRHRVISLHSSGASTHTVPGGQSALLRQSESDALCSVPDFLNWVSVTWASREALASLLVLVCDEGIVEVCCPPSLFASGCDVSTI